MERKLSIHPAIIDFDAEYSDYFRGSEALDIKRWHVKNVEKFIERLITEPHADINDDLLRLCGKHHDDGRVKQFEMLGKFWDTEISHNVLGVELFDKFVQAGGYTDLDESVEVLRNVILYHGRVNLCVSSISKPYVELVTAADDLENAASCVSYLVREVKNDEKGYCKKNPEADQKVVSDFVFEHFAKGEKFDKMKFCNTYAEYVLFAGTLMTSCIKKYAFAKNILLEPAYGYASILEGYKAVFEETLTPQIAHQSYEVLKTYAYSK